MPVSATTRRIMSWCAGISSEKKATACSWSTDMLRAMVSVKAVLPIEGRAAMMIRSDGCQPIVTRSSAMKPDGTPLKALLFLAFSSICASVRASTSAADCTERFTCPSATLKISCSAKPIRSVTSVDSS